MRKPRGRLAFGRVVVTSALALAKACLMLAALRASSVGAVDAAVGMPAAPPAPQPAREFEDILGCDGDAAQSAWCVERVQALEARAKIEAILAILGEVEQPPWPPDELAAATVLFDQGVALFGDEYFGDAAAKFEPALAQLESIRDGFEGQVANTASAAAARLDAEEFEQALAGFRQVLMWRPDHQQARQGAARAESGQRVQQTAAEAMRLLQAGETEQARALLGGLGGETVTSTLRKARSALADVDRRMRRNDLISTGHRALDRQDWAAATEAFRKALDLDPQSTAARDGLAQARSGASASELAMLRQALAATLAQESWDAAIATIGRIAALDPDAPEVRGRRPELERLVALEARLDRTLADPRRAAARAFRAETRALIDETRSAEAVGQRIHGKGRQLEAEFGKWTVPVAVTIRSDEKTDIRIRPGRKLGLLRETRLQVYPGTYTLVGRRQGYREKKVEISILPGGDAVVVDLICDERF